MGKTLSTRFLPTFRNITTPQLSVPLLVSDHSSVKIQPKQRVKTSQTKQTVISRDLRPSTPLAMQTYLYEVDVTAMIGAMNTCEEKVLMSQNIIKTGLDFVSPMKPKTVHPTEPPWINSTLKNLTRKRQVALGRGNRAEFNYLRILLPENVTNAVRSITSVKCNT